MSKKKKNPWVDYKHLNTWKAYHYFLKMYNDLFIDYDHDINVTKHGYLYCNIYQEFLTHKELKQFKKLNKKVEKRLEQALKNAIANKDNLK